MLTQIQMSSCVLLVVSNKINIATATEAAAAAAPTAAAMAATLAGVREESLQRAYFLNQLSLTSSFQRVFFFIFVVSLECKIFLHISCSWLVVVLRGSHVSHSQPDLNDMRRFFLVNKRF